MYWIRLFRFLSVRNNKHTFLFVKRPNLNFLAFFAHFYWHSIGKKGKLVFRPVCSLWIADVYAAERGDNTLPNALRDHGAHLHRGRNTPFLQETLWTLVQCINYGRFSPDKGNRK
jgi:hypothetical protein